MTSLLTVSTDCEMVWSLVRWLALSACGAVMGVRIEQREATRERILDAAVDALVSAGYAGISTVAVQRAAGISRGALLHHFPSRAALVEALVAHLVGLNETVVCEVTAQLPSELDVVTRALRALYETLARPAFQAELELWAVSRTDSELRAALWVAERAAGRDLRRVVDEAFGPTCVNHPSYPMVADLTIALIRGLVTSLALRSSDAAGRQLIEHWAGLVRDILDQPPAL